jgi:hypothetical protein
MKAITHECIAHKFGYSTYQPTFHTQTISLPRQNNNVPLSVLKGLPVTN